MFDRRKKNVEKSSTVGISERVKTNPVPPTPIRIPAPLLAKIQAVATLMDKSQQEVMRLAMEIGLEDLRRCNYDLAAAVVDASERAQSLLAGAMLSEHTPTYGATDADAAAQDLNKLNEQHGSSVKVTVHAPKGRTAKKR